MITFKYTVYIWDSRVTFTTVYVLTYTFIYRIEGLVSNIVIFNTQADKSITQRIFNVILIFIKFVSTIPVICYPIAVNSSWE